MRKPIMKLVAKTFLTWLAKRLPPGGQPFLHNLEAEFIIVIDSMPETDGPNFNTAAKLDEKVIRNVLEWALKAVRDAHTGEALVALLTYVLGILEVQAVNDIMELLTLPASTTDPHNLPKDSKSRQDVVKK